MVSSNCRGVGRCVQSDYFYTSFFFNKFEKENQDMVLFKVTWEKWLDWSQTNLKLDNLQKCPMFLVSPPFSLFFPHETGFGWTLRVVVTATSTPKPYLYKSPHPSPLSISPHPEWSHRCNLNIHCYQCAFLEFISFKLPEEDIYLLIGCKLRETSS